MPNLTPNAAPPGSLADSRVGAETFQRIRKAQGIEVVSFAQEREAMVTRLPADKVPRFADRIANLLREDHLYILDGIGLNGYGDLELRLLDPHLDTRINFFPRAHYLKLQYVRKEVTRTKELFMGSVGKQFIELIQQMAPADARVMHLSFTPVSASINVQSPNISADILHTMRSVRPGMRRVDVLRILQAEGGISSPSRRQFVYPKPVNKKGLRAKVMVQFVPASARIRWLDGIGYPLDTQVAMAMRQERQDDIVVQVSPIFTQYSIND